MPDSQTNNSTTSVPDTSTPTTSVFIPSSEPVHQNKKKLNVKMLLVGLFLLAVTLPLTILFLQQQQEIRSRAGDTYQQCMAICAGMEKSDLKQACKNNCDANKNNPGEIPASSKEDCEQNKHGFWCGKTPSGCGGFCNSGATKTCDQMLQEKCNYTPTSGASCSLIHKTGYDKPCTCGTTPVWFDRSGVCNSNDGPPTPNSPGYYDKYGLCGVFDQGSCGSTVITQGTNQCQFTCTSDGCSCSATDSTCTVYHYKCDRNTNLGGGCQDGSGSPSKSATFSSSCGAEQIDVACSGQHVGFRSKIYPTACKKTNINPTPTPTPRPTRTPTPSPTSGPTPTPTPSPTEGPTPTPTSTPTPTPTPVPPLTCNSACTVNADCQSELICIDGACRNPSCTGQNNCVCQVAAAPTPKIPVSGTGPSVLGASVIAGGFLILLLGLAL